jgi:ferrous iron transport protein B
MSTTNPYTTGFSADTLIAEAAALRPALGESFRDELVNSLYRDAETIANRAVKTKGARTYDLDQRIDRIVTSPVWGLPIMGLLLAAIFYMTIEGANVPSRLIADALFWLEAQGSALFNAIGLPWWLTSFLWEGVYRALAWVVAVMLPPMAIFFPIFTVLEDLGYLPRVAFNMDFLFKRAGAHGKQALTMAMGFGCNAAGVIATRVIDSPRERLIAILTNNFVPCNGRWPTLIMLATLFVGAAFPPAFSSLAAAGSIVLVTLIGAAFTLGASWALSRTILKGEASAFTLELPPYRVPNIGRILYTSLIDRTIFVLLRAMATAAPAGAVIWILGNINLWGVSLAQHTANLLDPLGWIFGLDGVILLAYIIAIPANEIVVPTLMMVYLGTSGMVELESAALKTLLVDGHGWTMLTAVNLMLFSLLHNPCATTILTIYKETGSKRWAAVSVLITLGLAFLVTFLTATIARLAGWVG